MEYADYIIGSFIFINIGINLFVKQIKINLITQLILYLISIMFMILNMFLNRVGIEEVLSLGHGNPYALLEADSFMIRTNIIFLFYSLVYIIFLSRKVLKVRN